MRGKSTTRARRLTSPALAEFHALTGHTGPADLCQDCATVLTRQRRDTSALRAHQRQARQYIDAILTEAATS
jgi:hypothetical protein